jgi:hypothetical protein
MNEGRTVAASTGGWLRTYLEQEFSVSARTSGTILAIFFAIMMGGRLIGSEITKRMRGSFLVLACSVGAIGLIWLAMGWKLLGVACRYRFCGPKCAGSNRHLAHRWERVPAVLGTKHFCSPGTRARDR